MNRITYIDSLRGFAILAVILTHVASFTKYNGIFSSIILQAGYGVQLFFVISAFTIFLTLENAMSKNELFMIKNFFIKRLLRIAPVYWSGIVVYTIFFGLDTRGWLPGPELWHYPMHFIFVNLLHPETPSSVVPGGWSISCEVLFYLICPFLFKIIKSLKSAFIFCLFSILLGVAFILLSKITLLPLLEESYGNKLAGQFVHRNIISQVGIFSFGILMFFLYRSKNIMETLSSKKINYLCLLISFTLIFVGLSGIFRGASHYVMAAAFTLFALCLAGRDIAIFDNKLLSFIGRISFSAYLIHFLAIHLAVYFIGDDSNFFAVLICTLAITIPLSYISFNLIEKNSTKLAKLIINNRKKEIVAMS
jgi:peptidoglycan/LPS O-acetylase OafA/YrhL